MKKKFFVVIAIIVVLVILLTPVRMNLKDGGSVRYKALVYEVTKIHRLAPEVDGVKTYIDGFEIKILGMTVYRETNELTNSSLEEQYGTKSRKTEFRNTGKFSSTIESFVSQRHYKRMQRSSL